MKPTWIGCVCSVIGLVPKQCVCVCLLNSPQREQKDKLVYTSRSSGWQLVLCVLRYSLHCITVSVEPTWIATRHCQAYFVNTTYHGCLPAHLSRLSLSSYYTKLWFDGQTDANFHRLRRQQNRYEKTVWKFHPRARLCCLDPNA